MSQRDIRSVIHRLMADAGHARAGELIAAEARPAVMIESQRNEVAPLPIGASKIGGLPDLSPEALWPEWHGIPMAFLLQLRLTELCDFECCADLPVTGLLSFFYYWHDLGGDTGIDWAEDGMDCCRVIFTENEGLVRSEAPAELSIRFQECALSFQAGETPPPWKVRTALPITDEAHEASVEVFDALYRPEFVDRPIGGHQLFGHPDEIQEGTAALSLPGAGPTIRNWPQSWLSIANALRRRFRRDAPEWLMLLQVASDDQADMMWCDVGKIYFWIRRGDIRDRRFDRTWAFLQFH